MVTARVRYSNCQCTQRASKFILELCRSRLTFLRFTGKNLIVFQNLIRFNKGQQLSKLKSYNCYKLSIWTSSDLLIFFNVQYFMIYLCFDVYSVQWNYTWVESTFQAHRVALFHSHGASVCHELQKDSAIFITSRHTVISTQCHPIAWRCLAWVWGTESFIVIHLWMPSLSFAAVQ